MELCDSDDDERRADVKRESYMPTNITSSDTAESKPPNHGQTRASRASSTPKIEPSVIEIIDDEIDATPSITTSDIGDKAQRARSEAEIMLELREVQLDRKDVALHKREMQLEGELLRLKASMAGVLGVNLSHHEIVRLV